MRKHPPQPYRRVTGGFTLLECLVYISLLFIVLGLAFAVFDRFQTGSRSLARNAQDIARALRAAERWREDIRAATGEIQLEERKGYQTLQIPSSPGAILYDFKTNGVSRTAGDPPRTIILLPQITRSVIHFDQRRYVRALRWELELPSPRASPRVKPFFTFEAVPQINPRL